MYTGNQNRAREEKNLDALLQITSDNPAVYTPKGRPKGNPNLMAEKNRNFNINKLYTGSAFSTDNYLNLNNYSNLNRAGGYGGGMQDISAQRGPGGTGGGSEDTEGNMDANQLLELNPYLSKNVTSFNDGGMFGEFAKYNHGGTVGSMTPPSWSDLGVGGSTAGQYVPHQPGSSAYKAFVDQGVIPKGNTTFNPYTGQYSREVKQRYDNGGMMTQQQMPQQTESYAKQANDMIALAQLEAFGKKFASQMPQEAANGMKRLYQQGGNYPHNMYNTETGYKIVAQNEAAHTKLASDGFDHTPKAKYGMKMKKYTQGGRF